MVSIIRCGKIVAVAKEGLPHGRRRRRQRGAGAWAAQAARVGGAAALLLAIGLLLAPVATLGSVFHARHGKRTLDYYPFWTGQTCGSTVLHAPND